MDLGSNNYRAVLPPAQCSDTPQFYFQAMGDRGGSAVLPRSAPAGVFSTQVGTVQMQTALEADFNGALPAGWTATGLWHISGGCAPAGSPCAGTQWAYYGQESSCDYNTGTTNSGLLTAPPISVPPAAPGGSVMLSYCSALQTENDPTYDRATVLVNNVEVDQAPESASWSTREVDLRAYAGQTVTIAFKFDSVDGVNNMHRGWQIDRVRVTAQAVGCNACYANCDGSTAQPLLNVNDFVCFQNRFASGDSYANCDQSTVAPVLNVNDFLCFQNQFAAGCP
jgi:hypothetical protein